MIKTVLVANPKGGSGKTTLATNIAGFLANRNERVVLWDLDRQGSALHWLSLRSEALPRIEKLDSKKEEKSVLKKASWLVIDSPAGLHGRGLTRLLKLARKVIVPIQPSVFDIGATEEFVSALMEEKSFRKKSPFAAMVGMRVDPRTQAASRLEASLEKFDLPVLSNLRNAQIYVNAAFQGRSIFDLPQNLAKRDLEQWEPLTDWLED